MSNPVFDITHKSYANELGSMYKQFITSMNPYALFSQMASNNPQMKPIMQMLSNGTSPETIARQMMKERGINPEEFLKSLGNYKG